MATRARPAVAANGLLHFLEPAVRSISNAALRETEAKQEKEDWLRLIFETTTLGAFVRLRFLLSPTEYPVASSDSAGGLVDAEFKKRRYMLVEGDERYIEGTLVLGGFVKKPELGGWGWLISQAGEYHFVPINAGLIVAVQIGDDMAALPGFDQPFDPQKPADLDTPLEDLY